MTAPVTITMDPEAYDRLIELAERAGLGEAELASDLLQAALEMELACVEEEDADAFFMLMDWTPTNRGH